jgi:hypothetical protein
MTVFLALLALIAVIYLGIRFWLGRQSPPQPRPGISCPSCGSVEGYHLRGCEKALRRETV